MLKEYLDAAAKKINIEVEEYRDADPTPLRQAAAHLLLAGGKRIRPALLLLSADAITGGSSERVFPAAFALELLHTYTLIHDDIMDNDDLRRGTPTVHTVFGMNQAILAGDILYGDAFSYICRADATDTAKTAAVQMLSHTAHVLCEGQSLDILFETRDDISINEYLKMIRSKTGSLLAASAGIGGILAGGTSQEIAALYTLGYNAGCAFQIRDDILDLIQPSEVLGKPQASDLRENKQTIISLYAREAGIDLSPYHKQNLTGDDIKEAIETLESAGIIAKATAYAENLISDAKAGLAVLPETEEKTMLTELADMFLIREH